MVCATKTDSPNLSSLKINPFHRLYGVADSTPLPTISGFLNRRTQLGVQLYRRRRSDYTYSVRFIRLFASLEYYGLCILFSRAMATVDSNSDSSQLTDAEIRDLQERQRRSTRVIVVLIAVVLILGLALPLVFGFATHWLLSYYEVATPPLRIWLSVGASVAALVLIHTVVMVPLTTFMATQSARLQSAFEGEGLHEAQAQKLIQTVVDAQAPPAADPSDPHTPDQRASSSPSEP